MKVSSLSNEAFRAVACLLVLFACTARMPGAFYPSSFAHWAEVYAGAGQVAIADAPRSWRAWDELRRRGVPPPGYVLAESLANGGRIYLKAR